MKHFILTNWKEIIVSSITIITFIRVFILERSRLKINIIEYDKIENNLDVYISFINSSKLPTSITNIEIKHKGQIIGVINPYTELVYSKGNKNLIYSNSLPVNLTPFSSDKDLFRFRLIDELPTEKEVKFVFETSRNRQIVKLNNFKLPKTAMEFHRKLHNHKKVSNKNQD